MGSGKEYGVSHLNSYFSNKKRKKSSQICSTLDAYTKVIGTWKYR